MSSLRFLCGGAPIERNASQERPKNKNENKNENNRRDVMMKEKEESKTTKLVRPREGGVDGGKEQEERESRSNKEKKDKRKQKKTKENKTSCALTYSQHEANTRGQVLIFCESFHSLEIIVHARAEFRCRLVKVATNRGDQFACKGREEKEVR